CFARCALFLLRTPPFFARPPPPSGLYTLSLHDALPILALAEREAATPQIGRTHGQHAVPITFGFAIALYVERLGGRIEQLQAAREGLVGKLTGAVGAYNALSLLVEDPEELERRVLARLGLRPAPVASQILPPEPF